jgi:hypothetical protein
MTSCSLVNVYEESASTFEVKFCLGANMTQDMKRDTKKWAEALRQLRGFAGPENVNYFRMGGRKVTKILSSPTEAKE